MCFCCYLTIIIIILIIGFLIRSNHQNHLFKQSVSKLVIDNLSKVYVINLDRSSDRKERYEKYLLEKFGEKFLGKDIKTLRFRGSDGKNDLIFVDEKKPDEKIPATDITSGKYELKDYTVYKIFDKNEPDVFIRYKHIPEIQNRKPSIGEFGCTLAHIRAINDIAKNNLPAGLIMEDDFVADSEEKFYKNFQNQLNNIPSGFEFVKFDDYSSYIRKRLGVAEKRSKFLLGKNKYFINLKFFNRGSIGRLTAYLVSYDGAVKIINFLRNNVIIGRRAVADNLLLNYLPKYQGFENFYLTKKPLFYQFDRVGDGLALTSSSIREIDNDGNVSGLKRQK